MKICKEPTSVFIVFYIKNLFSLYAMPNLTIILSYCLYFVFFQLVKMEAL